MTNVKALLAAGMIMLLAVRCMNKNDNYAHPIHSDTSRCIGIFRDQFDGQVKFDEMRRVVRDVYDFTETDSLTRKKMWTKDTFYLVIQQTLIADSNMSKKYKVPMLDSSGKRNHIPLYYIYNKTFVRSGWDNADSAISELQRLK